MPKAGLDARIKECSPYIYGKHTNGVVAFVVCLHCHKGLQCNSRKSSIATFIEHYSFDHKDCKQHFSKYQCLYQREPTPVKRVFNFEKTSSSNPITRPIPHIDTGMDKELKSLLKQWTYLKENETLDGYDSTEEMYDVEFVKDHLKKEIRPIDKGNDDVDSKVEYYKDKLERIRDIVVRPPLEYMEEGREILEILR
jgi:hypothetical protein